MSVLHKCMCALLMGVVLPLRISLLCKKLLLPVQRAGYSFCTHSSPSYAQAGETDARNLCIMVSVNAVLCLCFRLAWYGPGCSTIPDNGSIPAPKNWKACATNTVLMLMARGVGGVVMGGLDYRRLPSAVGTDVVSTADAHALAEGGAGSIRRRVAISHGDGKVRGYPGGPARGSASCRGVAVTRRFAPTHCARDSRASFRNTGQTASPGERWRFLIESDLKRP